MSDTMHQPRWRRWLDGAHTWGSLDESLPRYGVTRYRLIVFPPGIPPEDRMLLRAWRAWPSWGLATFLVLEMLLVPVLNPGFALAISTSVLLGSGGVLMAMTASFRGGVRTMTVTRMAGTDDAAAVQRLVELKALTRDLAFADRRLADGEISTVEHESVVWDVYDRLAAVTRARST